MVSSRDIQNIAAAVWNFPQNGVKTRDRLQGIDNAANGANNKTQQLVNGLLRRDSGGTHDGTKGDLYTRIAWMDMRIRKLEATLGRTDDAGTGNKTKADIYTRITWTGNFVKKIISMLQTIIDKLEAKEANNG